MAVSISGNAGLAGVIVTWTGTTGGRATADSQGNYNASPLPPGTYTLTASLAGFAFNPPSQLVIVGSVNVVGINFAPVSTSTPAKGFGCSFIAQNTAELTVFVSAGRIKGTNVNGQTVVVPSGAQTYIWVDNSGDVLTGAGLPPGVYAIALVTTGDVQTSGSGPNAPGGFVQSAGVVSITDLRT